MPSFGAELDRLCAKTVRALGRELRGDEIERLEGELFEQWIAADRLDELIRSVLARFGTDGGQTEIFTLAHHLRKSGDAARIDALFGGLLSRRVKAFYGWWKQAETGHLGAMQAAARAAAAAMDAYIEYFDSLHALGLYEVCEELRAEMLRFQRREPLRQVLPRGLCGRAGKLAKNIVSSAI